MHKAKVQLRKSAGLVIFFTGLRDWYLRVVKGEVLYLVYSEGKSGTTAVYNSLRAAGLNRVYQLHSLDHNTLTETENR